MAARALINEDDTSVLPSAVTGSTYQALDYYIQCGQEELNRIAKYHVTDDTSLTPVVGTQEYALPADCVEVLWIEYNGSPLKKTDETQLRTKNVNWRLDTAAVIKEYFVYGRKIVLYPAPNASASGVLTIRYVSTPVDFGTTAFAQLGSQDHNVPLLYAASLFLSLHSESAQALQRAQMLNQMFLQSAQRVQAAYAGRGVL